MISNMVANLFSPQKSQTLSQKRQKKPNTSVKAYSHKTCIIKHKIDIKTRQIYHYNFDTIPIFRNIVFSSNYTVLHLFLINDIDDF